MLCPAPCVASLGTAVAGPASTPSPTVRWTAAARLLLGRAGPGESSRSGTGKAGRAGVFPTARPC